MKRLILILAAFALLVPVGVSAQNLDNLRDRDAHAPIHVRGAAQAAPFAYSPQNMQALPFYNFSGLYAKTTGAGQVIAIVDAYDDPTIASDLQTFVTRFGGPIHTGNCTVNAGPHPCFQKVYAQGKPRANGGWALEIALDVEWAHAVAPGADILLVEAANSSLGNLLGAVATATSGAYPGVHVVSMSWGSGEFSGETLYDSYFTAQNVMFVAASGDSGTPTWPAASPYVVGAGGTMFSSVVKDSTCSMSIGPECAWNDAYIGYSGSGGGGISTAEPEPGYQQAFGVSSGGYRGIPDIAYFADINPGVSVYDSTSYNGQRGWFAVGGTSAASPQWAAIFALVNQLRNCGAGGSCLPRPVGAPSPALLYTVAAQHYSSGYNNITQGCNGIGECAGPGYDFATGIGSPQIYNLVNYLAGVP
jgi:subtilase family serine protease